MKPICVLCQRFFRMVKAGYYFTEMMPKSGRPLPGTQQPDRWTPYKIWSGDLYECQGCKAQIVSGVGGGPISEHYQANFTDVSKNLKADQLKVNDC